MSDRRCALLVLMCHVIYNVCGARNGSSKQERLKMQTSNQWAFFLIMIQWRFKDHELKVILRPAFSFWALGKPFGASNALA
jgi:hypothetical protein